MDAENHREKRSLAELMSCIFNAAGNTEKMSRIGLEPKKSSATNLSRDQRKRGSAKQFVICLNNVQPVKKHGVSQVARARQQIPRVGGLASLAAESGEIFRSEGGGPSPVPTKNPVGWSSAI